MNNIEILIDNFEQLKKNKFIIESIDPEFFFKFGENLIQENKKIKKQMGKDLDVVYIKGAYDERDKWKNKIKEIIGELEKQEDWYIENKSLDDLYGKIDILQKLLEEGE
jgi:predicted adenine nucleotide alpha hydrolase (AANH) superfamily ATPase